MISVQQWPGGLKRAFRTGLCAVLFLSELGGSFPAWACSENAMLVFDASGSMVRRHNGIPKIAIARQATSEVLPDVTRYRRTGLVTYGGLAGPSCRDVVVRLELQANSASRINALLKQIQPLGPTALTTGVRTAANVLRKAGGPGVIVLITDGLESCKGNGCALARQLRQQSPELTVHVIAFLLVGKKIDTLTCLSSATNGTYVSANSLESLRDALRKLLNCQRLS